MASSVKTTQPKIRGRKRKLETPIKETPERAELFVTDQQAVYCRAPIEFSGLTIFTKVEKPPVTNASSSMILPSGASDCITTTTTTTVSATPKIPPVCSPSSTVEPHKEQRVQQLQEQQNWQRFAEKGVQKYLKKLENTACWHCTYPFENEPVSLPVQYSIRRGFQCHGIFCSWNCAKGWNNESQSAMKYRRLDMLCQLVKMASNGKSKTVVAAPSRYTLKKFCGEGGKTIEEFRADNIITDKKFFTKDFQDKNFLLNYTTKTPTFEIEF